MIKKFSMSITLFLFLLFSFTTTPVFADDDVLGEIVYIDDPDCSDCKSIREAKIVEQLEAQGYQVTVLTLRDHFDEAYAYITLYRVPAFGGRAVGIMFAGNDYYRGYNTVSSAFASGELQESAQTPLRDISEFESREIAGLSGLLYVMLLGLIDGINPCAIAMLLMFISMIGFTKNLRVLLTVSISYIGAIFVTYFFIGLGILSLLNISRSAFVNFSIGLYIFFALLCLVLFLLTFYDFLVTRNQKYEKIKNQLPKYIQNLNKRVMKRFTEVINQEEGSLQQSLLIVFIPFLIGIIVGITEAACTGQIYFVLLGSLEQNLAAGVISMREIGYLLVFNLMFILPLILIALIAVKSRSVVGIANFIREHLSTIKLITAIFFFIMAIYFVLLLFNLTFTDLIYRWFFL